MLMIYKTAAMQKLQRAAFDGYYWMNSGVVESYRLKPFQDKIIRRYKLNRSRAAFSKDRKKGKAVVGLVTYPCSQYFNKNGFYWFLYSTQPLAKENLFDIRRQPLRFGQDYQLIRQSKKETDHPVWTWKLIKERKEAWKEILVHAIKQKRKSQLKAAYLSLASAPHFYGIRQDRKELWQVINATWRRTFKDSIPAPKLPINKFKRSVKIESVKQVTRFVNTMEKYDRSAEEQMRIYILNRKRRNSQSFGKV